jgi:hypothetical protein
MSPDSDPDPLEPEAFDFAVLFSKIEDDPDYGSAFAHADHLATLEVSFSRAPSAVTDVTEWRRRWSDLQTVPVQEVGRRSFHLAVSRRLTAWAARILPVADRSEYEELFGSELYELAQSDGGRRAQLAYALRVLVRAPLLRRELRAPARERSW